VARRWGWFHLAPLSAAEWEFAQARENDGVFSQSIIQQAMQRAMADGVLQPTKTKTVCLDNDGVRFVLRTVSSLARKDKAPKTRRAKDPLGDYEPSLFVSELGPSHYVLLNKFPVLDGHVLIVTRRFDRQERLLGVDDFAALGACLGEVDGLGFYNGGAGAGASQGRKHLQLVPLPLDAESPERVPMEQVLESGAGLPFRHAFERVSPQAMAPELHALYRELLDRCGISAVEDAGGELQSGPYNMLVRRGWMLVVPRSRACFESISVNALGFSGSLFLRSQEELERVRAVGPMQVLCAVAMPQA
jgi:ATP adenylyltransferase